MLETDFFADITGGDSFSDIYGLKRFVFGFFRKLLPIMFNKELILLPQTYGPFNKPLMKCMARYILKHANVIYSRDIAGVEYVSKLLNGAEDKVRCVPDLAFVLDSRRPSDIDIGSLSDVRTEESVVVGFNISGLLYYGGCAGNNMFGLKEDYERIICRIIDFLMTKKNILVLLVPHIFPPVEIFEAEIVENDVAACLDVYKKFHTKYPARIFMVRGRYDQGEIKYIIGLCNFFMGSRMHSTIAALSQCVPAVGMAYSKKFAGVFQMAEVEEYVVDMRQLDEAQTLERISELYGTRESARRRLCEVIPKVQEKVMSLFDDF
jgi:polysaccharide pyruvyl transferase WcaK-like protein